MSTPHASSQKSAAFPGCTGAILPASDNTPVMGTAMASKTTRIRFQSFIGAILFPAQRQVKRREGNLGENGVPPLQGGELFGGEYTWGCAQGASPQALTLRAFSPDRMGLTLELPPPYVGGYDF